MSDTGTARERQNPRATYARFDRGPAEIARQSAETHRLQAQSRRFNRGDHRGTCGASPRFCTQFSVHRKRQPLAIP